MNIKYKNIIMAMLLVIIIIIIIILTIFLLNKKENGIDLNNKNIGDAGLNIDYSVSEIENVTDKIEYYTVRNCINNYFNILNSNNSIYYVGDEIDEDAQKEYIYNLLGIDYIKSNNITVNNVLNKVETTKEQKVFIPLQMKVLKKERVDKYIVYGVLQDVIELDDAEEIYIIVNLDYNNKTFSIEPIDKEYESIEQINIENDDILIDKNENNIYQNQKITNEYLTNEYFVLYKKLAITEPELVYNIFSEEYRNERFGNIDNFKKYVNENKNEILKINMQQYLVNNYESYTEYVAKDQYGNLYIFKESSDNELIDINLDTYTLKNDKFFEEYNKSSNEKKVQMNVDKFIQMINRHDYKTSYNCISSGFKKNYLDTQEKFEEYMKNVFFEYNNFEFRNIEQKGSNLYTVTLNITDLTEESSETRNVTIIMQLNDDLDFEMSFGIE